MKFIESLDKKSLVLVFLVLGMMFGFMVGYIEGIEASEDVFVESCKNYIEYSYTSCIERRVIEPEAEWWNDIDFEIE